MADQQTAEKEKWVPKGDLQKVVDPVWLLREAPRETQFITGSEAAREAILWAPWATCSSIGARTE